MKKIFILIPILLIISNPIFSKDYFWVGGTGKWHAFFEHWAFESGGIALEHGQVPGTKDNVYFDDNSFGTENEIVITIEADAVCRDLDFTRITDPNKKIILNHNGGVPFHIYGSALFTNQITINTSSIITFYAEDGDYIFQTAGNKFNHLLFLGQNAKWNMIDGFWTNGAATFNGDNIYELNDSMYVNHSFNANGGLHNFNDVHLRCNEFMVRNSETIVNLKTSYIDVYNRFVDINNKIENFRPDNSVITEHSSNSELITRGHNFNVFNFENNNQGYNFIKGNANFKKLYINANLKIEANTNSDEIEIIKGHKIEFKPGTEHTINDKFIAMGDCDYGVLLYTGDYRTAKLISQNADFETDYLHIEAIIAEGGADFKANNSYDIDENLGWNFDPYTPRTLYWVGGGGNWNDRNHWSLSTGGAGGECIPSALDDVFIDDNSGLNGQTIAYSSTVIFCKNFDARNFSGKVTIENLKDNFIYSSMWLSGNFNFTKLGIVRFRERNETCEIQTNNNTMQYTIMLDENTSWSFLDDYYSIGNIFFTGGNSVYDLFGDMSANLIEITGGTLNTNGGQLDVNDFHQRNGTIAINFFNSIVNVSKHFRFFSGSFNFDAGTSQINLYGDDSHLYSQNKQFYNVLFENNSRFNSHIFQDAKLNKLEVKSNLKIRDNLISDTIYFSPGYTTEIIGGRSATFTNNVKVDGNCNEYVFLRNNGEMEASFFMEGAAVEANYIILENISALGDTPYSINNAVDLGGNIGWDFINATGRELYWVGGVGDWSDESHWSLTSGGIGGECPPSAFDIVNIDQQSGSSDFTLDIDTPVAFCKDFIVQNNDYNLLINNKQYLRFFGSAFLQENVNFTDRESQLQFYGSNGSATISGMNCTFPKTQIYGNSQTYSFENNLRFKQHFELLGKNNTYNINTDIYGTDNLGIHYGIINSNEHNIDFPQIFFNNNSNELVVNMGSSTFNARHRFQINSEGINAQNSIINFPNANSNLDLNISNVLNEVNFLSNSEDFSNINGNSSTITKLHSEGSLKINGSHFYDTLSYTAGATYITNSPHKQTIFKHWQLRGNQCFPIVLESNDKDNISYYQDDGIVSGDFLQLKNIKAEGNAIFYAGRSSDNFQNSNTNWEFANSPGYIYGLGNDTIMCPGEFLIPVNFNGAKEYIWSNGITGERYEITQSEEVTIQAIYGKDCIFYDTMYVRLLEEVEFFTEDAVVCEPNEECKVFVDSDADATNLQVSWFPTIGISDPSSKTVTIISEIERDYVVSIGNGECITSNTVSYLIVENIIPELIFDGTYLISSVKSGNKWFYEGEELIGETDNKLLPSEEGNYSVRVEANGCLSSFSEPIFFDDPNRADVIVRLPFINTTPGEIVNVPIQVSIRNELIKAQLDNFNVDLTYNGAISYNQDAKLINKSATITDFTLNKNSSGVWGDYNLQVMLSTDVETVLDAVNVTGISSSYTYEVIPGLLKVSGLCEEDGLRLFSDTDIPFNVEISPNPTDKDLVITLSLIDESNIELSITDINGKILKILDDIYLSPGIYQKNYSISGLSNGSYFLNLKNKGRSKTIRFEVVK